MKYAYPKNEWPLENGFRYAQYVSRANWMSNSDVYFHERPSSILSEPLLGTASDAFVSLGTSITWKNNPLPPNTYTKLLLRLLGSLHWWFGCIGGGMHNDSMISTLAVLKSVSRFCGRGANVHCFSLWLSFLSGRTSQDATRSESGTDRNGLIPCPLFYYHDSPHSIPKCWAFAITILFDSYCSSVRRR